MDSEYSAYIVEGDDVKIGDHYYLVDRFTDWLKIYDDSGLQFNEHAKEFRVYRAAEMGCIIQIINK